MYHLGYCRTEKGKPSHIWFNFFFFFFTEVSILYGIAHQCYQRGGGGGGGRMIYFNEND